MWVIWALLFAFGICVFLFRTPLQGNELETIVFARAHVEPDFIKGDWFFSQPPGPRLPFQILISPLLRYFRLPLVTLIGRVLELAWLALGLGRLAKRLGLNAWGALVALALFLLINQSLAAGEWIFGTVESKVFAYGFVFLALDALIGRRTIVACSLLGASMILQPLVGAWASVAFALTAAAAAPRPRDIVLSTFVWLCFAVPAVLITTGSSPGTNIADIMHAAQIAVFFRVPHHTNPFFFLGRLYYYEIAAPLLAALIEFAYRKRAPRILGVVGVLAIIVAYMHSIALGNVIATPFFVWIALHALLTTRRDFAVVVTSRYALAAFGIFYVALVLAALPGAPLVLQLYPFRLGDSFFPLLCILLMVRLAADGIPSSVANHALRVAGVGIMIYAAVLFIAMGRHHPYDLTKPDAFAWVQRHTPANITVLVSPAIEQSPYWMRRATVVQFKFFPYTVAGVNQWYSRVLDMNGGRIPPAAGFRAEQMIGARFIALTKPEYLALAGKYHACYLILPQERRLSLPRVHVAGGYAVYRLPTC